MLCCKRCPIRHSLFRISLCAIYRRELAEARSNVDKAVAEAELEAVPDEPPSDILASPASKREVLVSKGVNPVPSSSESTGTLAYYAHELGIEPSDVRTMAKLKCCLQIVHLMRHGRAMLQYEQWHAHEVSMGMLPRDTGMGGDDSGWKAARVLDEVCLEELRRRMQESPFLAFSIDDSDDVQKRELMSLYTYLMREGRREAHLLKLHELPGAATSAVDIAREALHVLCTEKTGEPLHGEGYGIGGLTFAQLGEKGVGLSSDGAANMFAENGALNKLQKFAPHSVLIWDPAHRTGLSGRDLEKNEKVKEVKSVLSLIAKDMKQSTRRTQERLLALAAAAVGACAVIGSKDIRWLSLQRSLESILKQWGPLGGYYKTRAVEEADSEAEGIYRLLVSTPLVLFAHALMAVLTPVNAACKKFQERAAGLPDVVSTVATAKQRLQRTCIDNAAGATAAEPGASCGKQFADLVCNDRLGMNGNFAIVFIAHDDDSVADQVAGIDFEPDAELVALEFGPEGDKQVMVLWHAPEGRRTRRQPTLRSDWDALVAEARGDCRSVAEAMLHSLEQRFPEDTQRIFALAAFMNPSYWGLDGSMTAKQRAAAVDAVDLEQLQESMLKLASMFSEELLSEAGHTVEAKVTGAGEERDLDGRDGARERLLKSQLADEIEHLPGFVKDWPVIGGSAKEMVKWGEFWGDLTENEDFRSLCPLLLILLLILLTIPCGSVENERGFSGLNRLLDKLRNSMTIYHTNVVVRLNSQKDGMLADYSPQVLEFLRRMLAPSTAQAV